MAQSPNDPGVRRGMARRQEHQFLGCTASLYKTATVILALNRPLGPQLASERLNEIPDAIEAGSEPSRISLMEHLSMMKIPNVPEATLARMTKLAMAIQRFPGGLLYQCAVATNPASPAVEEVIFTVMKKPEGDNTMDMYGGYLNGIRGQKQNPAVRVMLQKLTTVDNEQVRKAAQAGLNEPQRKLHNGRSVIIFWSLFQKEPLSRAALLIVFA